MKIKAGFRLAYEFPAPTPINFLLDIHPSRRVDLLSDHQLTVTPDVGFRSFLDGFGNVCTRVDAPAGRLEIATLFAVYDHGLPDPMLPHAEQLSVSQLPDEALPYLLGSRYCDTDRLSDFAWSNFGSTPTGWARVQAICDFVHNHIRFDYQLADATRSASEALRDGVGVCRDFTHLAVAMCRAMNIPARYCTGYLGDIGVPAAPYPMDFSAWFEVYLGGAWHTFDARHNTPRIGRILMATGRDATDVAISTAFGPNVLSHFEVITDEVVE